MTEILNNLISAWMCKMVFIYKLSGIKKPFSGINVKTSKNPII
jgi:hypothetical protein